MTLAILIGAAILLSAGYILRRQGLDTLEFRAGRIRLDRGQALKMQAATEDKTKH
jgi:hypothetical protein